MLKRTSINIDIDLLDQAKSILGTSELTETVHKALAEVVKREKLRRFIDRELPDLTPEALEHMRRPRFGA